MNFPTSKLAWWLTALVLAGACHVKADVYINFDSVNASSSNVDATAYLASFGATLTNVNPAGTVIIQNEANSADITASSPPNFLLQGVAGSPPCSYTMMFNIPFGEVTFTRCAIGPEAVSAEWRATVYSGSTAVGSAGDAYDGDTGTSATTYSFYGPGITSLNITADGLGSSAISSVPLDDFHLTPVAIAVQPADQTSVVGTNTTFVVGGAGVDLNYQWQFDSTNLMDNGHITGSRSNVLVVADTALQDAGAYQVIVTNVYGSATSSVAVLMVLSQLAVSPSVLPYSSFMQPYSVALSACCGSPPYTYVVTAGSLPPGLSLSSDGVLSGKPAVAGTFSFTVQAADASGLTGSNSYVMTNCTWQTTPWTSLTPLPDGYQEHALVYANGFLYNIGGLSSSRGAYDGTNIFFSQVNSNGTLGTWNATTALPESVFDAAAVTDSGYVYVLGGDRYTDQAGEVWTTNTVYYAKINSNGTLGAWQTANPMPQSLFWFGASVWNHRIYVVGGINDIGDFASVNSASIQADGSLSAWATDTSLPVTISAECAVANGYLYSVAGATDNEGIIVNTVYFCKINSDGTLGSWNQTTPLPHALTNFGAVAGAGWVFAMCGWDGRGVVDTFYGAPVLGGGSLGNWSTNAPLPQSLLFNAATVSSNYIYMSGGQSPYITSSAVYSMPLPPQPTSPLLTSQTITNQNFQLQLTSSTNTGFGILASTDLTSWTNIGWGFTDTNGLLTFQDTNAASFPYRFYRAYWPLP